MNQMTTRNVEDKTIEQKQKLFNMDGGCSHVEADMAKGYALLSETDSFGPVATCLVCKECADAEKKRVGEEECVCHDCKKKVKRSEGGTWKWYDFYAAQGDIPLFLCNPCFSLPNHRARVQRDNDDYDREFGSDD